MRTTSRARDRGGGGWHLARAWASRHRRGRNVKRAVTTAVGEGSPIFMLKVKSSFFKAESLSKCHFDAFPARGKLPMKNVFHSKMDSLLYVEAVRVI